jgi:RND family efflux transporter MFP subunit
MAFPGEEGFPHQGTLKRFSDRVDTATGTVRVHASVPNPDHLLLPGMFVRIRMPFGLPQKVIEVPEGTIQSDRGIHFLVVVNDKDILERRAVTVGRVEGNMRIIEKGLGAGDWVVVGSPSNLMPGTHVKRRAVTDGSKEK